jgi:hypothetical protein
LPEREVGVAEAGGMEGEELYLHCLIRLVAGPFPVQREEQGIPSVEQQVQTHE